MREIVLQAPRWPWLAYIVPVLVFYGQPAVGRLTLDAWRGELPLGLAILLGFLLPAVSGALVASCGFHAWRPARFTLTTDGLEASSLWKRRRLSWNEVGTIELLHHRGGSNIYVHGRALPGQLAGATKNAEANFPWFTPVERFKLTLEEWRDSHGERQVA